MFGADLVKGQGMPNSNAQNMVQMPLLSREDYEKLARFRHALRQFTAFSDAMLERSNLGPRRYQAMLAIKAHGDDQPMSVGELARLLLIRPNTAAELVNRLENANLIERVKDPKDRRRALLALTADGARKLAEVAHVHIEKLEESRAVFVGFFDEETQAAPSA
ncbi:MarR family transcriptional regulator [Roseiarcaceae bacterium H3SJ34-1]|uniref:MarR family winged helix-turn-helix transcriptional regulator n=1 Tax=Terripilifer ovatus TaxID=3032367 RepID=UPI003AB97F6B|nr:MarR family transcriptional regulator [Roseiarcaceae bacterium H3SJ34-1]